MSFDITLFYVLQAASFRQSVSETLPVLMLVDLFAVIDDRYSDVYEILHLWTFRFLHRYKQCFQWAPS